MWTKPDKQRTRTQPSGQGWPAAAPRKAGFGLKPVGGGPGVSVPQAQLSASTRTGSMHANYGVKSSGASARWVGVRAGGRPCGAPS